MNLELKVASSEVVTMLPVAPSEIGKQLDVTEDSEANAVEKAEGSSVPSDGAGAQKTNAAGLGMGDDRLSELQADAAPPKCMADYERLQFGLAVTRDHASKADNSVAYRGDPKVLGADPMQVFIELQAGVVPTDTWALVDLAVPVGEFDPERAARRKIVRRVVPDRDWIGGR